MPPSDHENASQGSETAPAEQVQAGSGQAQYDPKIHQIAGRVMPQVQALFTERHPELANQGPPPHPAEAPQGAQAGFGPGFLITLASEMPTIINFVLQEAKTLNVDLQGLRF